MSYKAIINNVDDDLLVCLGWLGLLHTHSLGHSPARVAGIHHRGQHQVLGTGNLLGSVHQGPDTGHQVALRVPLSVAQDTPCLGWSIHQVRTADHPVGIPRNHGDRHLVVLDLYKSKIDDMVI